MGGGKSFTILECNHDYISDTEINHIAQNAKKEGRKEQINADAGVIHGDEPGDYVNGPSKHVNGRGRHESEALKCRNEAYNCGIRSSKPEDDGARSMVDRRVGGPEGDTTACFLRICRQVSEATDRRSVSRSTEEVVGEINRMLSGWANYFSLGTVSGVCNLVDRHVGYRLRMWLNAKHKVHCIGKKRFIDEATALRLGLDRLSWRKGSFPWANA